MHYLNAAKHFWINTHKRYRMPFNLFRQLTLLACTVVSLTVTTLANAQTWPTKNIRIVLQFSPGGATDVVARILAQHLTTSLGQTVVVENKPGADGQIAAEFVMRSEPDGHTFFMASNTPMMQVPLLKKNPPYDPLTSFTPVTLVGHYIYVMVANAKLPYKTYTELVAYGKANPGKLNFGSHSGVTQLMFSRMSKQNGLQMNLIPYKGEAPNVNDLLGGHVQFNLVSTISTLQHINDGKLTPLAVMLNKRLSLLPEVPTFAEAGLPALGAESWAALFGPAKLPAEITNRLRHYFLTYKNIPGEEPRQCYVSDVYNRKVAHEIINLSCIDYENYIY
jgi:tripartite-type tricarboxylate transporter receptor subunit TctC